jgi:hypothetical protein
MTGGIIFLIAYAMGAGHVFLIRYLSRKGII